jgi:DNA-binding protein H-NS
MSLKDLLERHQQLKLQLGVAREREVQIALTDMVRTMQQYGITVAELMGRKEGDAAPVAARLAKYKNPQTGATWSGGGRVRTGLPGRTARISACERPEAPACRLSEVEATTYRSRFAILAGHADLSAMRHARAAGDRRWHVRDPRMSINPLQIRINLGYLFLLESFLVGRQGRTYRRARDRHR